MEKTARPVRKAQRGKLVQRERKDKPAPLAPLVRLGLPVQPDHKDRKGRLARTG